MTGSASLIPYQCKEVQETFGGEPLRIWCLASLEQTIDAIFEELQKRGEQNLMDWHCPYFGVIWTAARSLADHLAARKKDLVGKSVLEVGCGLAIPSLLAARFGAQVVASDYHQEVPRFLEKNQKLNGVNVEFQRWDWRSPPDSVGNFDYILGSDLLYDQELPPLLAGFLAKVATEKTQIIITDPGRSYLQDFLDAMSNNGFQLKAESIWGERDARGEKVFLLAFRRHVA